MQRLMNAKGQSIKLRMKNILLLFIIVATATHCSKSKGDEPENGSLVGKWSLTMTRADPGDGSGTWRNYTGETVIIQFNEDGSYTDSRGDVYNRYSMHDSVITLSNSANSETFQLNVQELSFHTLSYYFGGFWCGGPAGEKFKRIPDVTHQ
jgi:hypothetical protein